MKRYHRISNCIRSNCICITCIQSNRIRSDRPLYTTKDSCTQHDQHNQFQNVIFLHKKRSSEDDLFKHISQIKLEIYTHTKVPDRFTFEETKHWPTRIHPQEITRYRRSRTKTITRYKWPQETFLDLHSDI